jgi:DNA-directed RNA polymerase specialized sigma24 family protein
VLGRGEEVPPVLHDTEWPGRSRVTPPSFQDELTRIWQDPQIRRLALRRAGRRDLADDALQETYYSVARVKDPDHIKNLRAFFCRALINQISHLRGQLNPIPVEDPEMLAGTQHGGRVHAAAARPVDEAAVWLQLAATWDKRFRREHERLMAMVPERSSDPRRYREVIVATAEQILHAAADGHVNWADSDDALRAAYPDWFNEPGCTRDTYYQRLSRARHEVRALVRVVVGRDEL